MISFAGTRLSEQPIQRYSGLCWRESFRKNSGSRRLIASAQAWFCAKRWLSSVMRGGYSARIPRCPTESLRADRGAVPTDWFLEMKLRVLLQSSVTYSIRFSSGTEDVV